MDLIDNETSSATSITFTSELVVRMMSLHALLNVLNPIVYGTLFIIGTVGNSLVVYVTLSPTTSRLATRPNHSMLVLNLALADVIYLLSSAPYQAISFSIPGWIFGSVLCPLLHFLSVWTMAVSIFTMCSLAVVRFTGLLLPYQTNTTCLSAPPSQCRVAMTMVLWALGAVLALPNLVYFKITEGPRSECTWKDERSHNAYWIAVVGLTFVAPFFLVTTLYIAIAVEVGYFMKRKDSRIITSGGQEGLEYKKLAMMVAFLISAFLLCWFPYHLYNLIQVSGAFDQSYAFEKSILLLLANCFSYAHACVNPIIYTFAAPGFRQSLCVSIRRHSPNASGACSWKRSDRVSKRNSFVNELPQTKLTPLTSERVASTHPGRSTCVEMNVRDKTTPKNT